MSKLKFSKWFCYDLDVIFCYFLVLRTISNWIRHQRFSQLFYHWSWSPEIWFFNYSATAWNNKNCTNAYLKSKDTFHHLNLVPTLKKKFGESTLSYHWFNIFPIFSFFVQSASGLDASNLINYYTGDLIYILVITLPLPEIVKYTSHFKNQNILSPTLKTWSPEIWFFDYSNTAWNSKIHKPFLKSKDTFSSFKFGTNIKEEVWRIHS